MSTASLGLPSKEGRVNSLCMESVPSLPDGGPLRPFVIWASAGVFFLVISMAAASLRRRWKDAGVAAIPTLILVVGLGMVHYGGMAHTYSTWMTVLAAVWAAHMTEKETSFFLFLGGLGLAGAGIIARTQLF